MDEHREEREELDRLVREDEADARDHAAAEAEADPRIMPLTTGLARYMKEHGR